MKLIPYIVIFSLHFLTIQGNICITPEDASNCAGNLKCCSKELQCALSQSDCHIFSTDSSAEYQENKNQNIIQYDELSFQKSQNSLESYRNLSNNENKGETCSKADDDHCGNCCLMDEERCGTEEECEEEDKKMRNTIFGFIFFLGVAACIMFCVKARKRKQQQQKLKQDQLDQIKDQQQHQDFTQDPNQQQQQQQFYDNSPHMQPIQPIQIDNASYQNIPQSNNNIQAQSPDVYPQVGQMTPNNFQLQPQQAQFDQQVYLDEQNQQVIYQQPQMQDCSPQNIQMQQQFADQQQQQQFVQFPQQQQQQNPYCQQIGGVDIKHVQIDGMVYQPGMYQQNDENQDGIQFEDVNIQ